MCVFLVCLLLPGQPWSHAKRSFEAHAQEPRSGQGRLGSIVASVPQRPSRKEAGTAKPTVDRVLPLREASRPLEAAAVDVVVEVHRLQFAIAALGDMSPHIRLLKHTEPHRPDPSCSQWRTGWCHVRCSSHMHSVALHVPKR